ncbi:4-hydroxybenzoate polyprenyltransferase [Nymphaea thermarum]|nr:4-hydroxybenzoate polyprenyltransferase [Nymphaea thermarum]
MASAASLLLEQNAASVSSWEKRVATSPPKAAASFRTKLASSGTWLDHLIPATLRPYAYLARMDKPVGTWLVAWPQMGIALAAAPGRLPDLSLLWVLAWASFFARGAGCTINDILDRDFDAKFGCWNCNTVAGFLLPIDEEINILGMTMNCGVLLGWSAVKGSLTLVDIFPLYSSGVFWTIIYDTIYAHQDKKDDLKAGVKSTALRFESNKYFGALVFFGILTGKLVQGIALAAPPGKLPDLSLMWALAWASFFANGLGCTINDILDRDFDAKPRAYLGLTMNCGVLMGWSAVKGSLSLVDIFPLYTAGVFWTIIYDTIYAHEDKKDDVKAGVKPTVLRFGESTKSWISGFGVASFTFFLLTGYTASFGWPYYAFLAASAAQLFWQIWTLDISRPQDCERKFQSNKYFGALVFLGILTAKLMQ